MDTHIHMLIKPENCTISDIMQFIKQCFTQWLNRRFGIKGTAWEARFFSKIVEFTEDIIRTFIYIEQNPVKAGLAGIRGLGKKIKSLVYPFYEVWEPLLPDELKQS
jgi:putative transposase